MRDEPTDAAPPPEATLLRCRRLALKMSPEQLERLLRENGARLSGKRIREIEHGRTKTGARTSARAETLVALAQALGIGADELQDSGRPDAAMLLHRRQSSESPLAPRRDGDRTAAPGADILQILTQGVEEIRRTSLSPQQKQRLERFYLRSLRRSVQAAHEQLRETLELVTDDEP
ncbi:hypothetical protein [Nocardiopsis algeriensis]|uniref:Transcriptional regulator with XRE-family HTH domain n=1 Tax=Nocardiopsis algeriensis TaxID=1478215 RepID=A0A841IP45_9ACTN|nr:hypothetical protein [Nocardiopsis algeriensis]MBB6119960.1 transcriptional regulator with XRE-family HTH domain [Nocardiopsis algeriensis]